MRRQILLAKEILPQVAISDAMLLVIAKIAVEVGVDGHRADLTMVKAAKTMAAFNGRKEVSEVDVIESVNLALQHRMRRQPFQEASIDRERLQDVVTGSELNSSYQCKH